MLLAVPPALYGPLVGRDLELTALVAGLECASRNRWLRRRRGCPWRIGIIVAAALVLLHHDHHRTT
jgi:hypothetical protein